MKTIYLPAIERRVTLGQYVAAVKAHPDREFKTGLTTWWPTTGREIMRQFYSGLEERINDNISYSER